MIPETGLLSWYPGDEASGNLLDAFGSSHGAAVNAPGSAGGMRTFNGTTQSFTLPSNFGLGAVGQAMTMYARVRFDSVAGAQCVIGADTAAGAQICRIDLSGGALRCVYGTSAGGFDILSTAADIAINTVYGIGFTLTAAGVGTLYRDGVAGATDPARTGAFSSIPAFWVGTLNSNGAPGARLAGRAGSIGIWNVANTPAEMASLHADPTFAVPSSGDGIGIGIRIGI